MFARNLLQRKTRSNVDKSDKQHSATPSASQHMVCTSRRACMDEACRHATRIHRSCTSEFLSLRCSGQGLEPQGPFAQRFPKAHVKLDSFLPGCEKQRVSVWQVQGHETTGTSVTTQLRVRVTCLGRCFRRLAQHWSPSLSTTAAAGRCH